MEIKNILGKINQSPEEPKKFFAIEIGYEVVKTALWHVQDKATQVISFGSIEEWKNDSAETLLEAVDKSLSIATKNFDQEKEPNEVIFGLPESWVGVDGIAESKKSFLKNVTKNLDLKPVGFVVTTEAIVHHLRLKEGGPPSTILAYLTESEVGVSLVKLGEILGTHVVGRSEDLCKDIEEGIARFGNVGDLPSRIIIYDGNIDLEAAKQTLINYDWQDTVNFLHFPKIEDLDPHSSITAIAIAGGTEVAKSLGIQIQEEDSISELGTTPSNLPENVKTAEELINPQDFGFSDPRKQEVLEEKAPIEEKISEGDNFSVASHDQIVAEQKIFSKTEEKKQETKSKFSFKLPKIKKFPSLKLPLLVPMGLGILILAAVGAFAAYWQLPKAEVIIYTKPKKVEKDIVFTLNAKQEVLDIQNDSIPAKQEAIELEGEKEATTTGSKIVGEKAKGTVNIFNLTQASKVFEAGTKLNFDNYIFTTNEKITVASATAEISADYKTTVTPSQAVVQVTASSIGDKYNFSKGTELIVANFAKSSFVAKASGDFKGGFSREIQAVSQGDRDSLKEALLGELKVQGIKNLSVVASQRRGVVELQEETIVDQAFSAEVGDEEDSLRLALKFKLPIYTYHFSDVGQLIEKKYASEFPANYTVDPENIEVEVIKSTVNEDGQVVVEAKVKIDLSPQLNTEEIANAIRGKYPEITKDYFKNLPNFSKVETTFNVNLPGKLQTFPRVAKNITVTIKLEK